eukprot:scaffold19689_cov31-Tisochrysis_lutea.AAC.4
MKQGPSKTKATEVWQAKRRHSHLSPPQQRQHLSWLITEQQLAGWRAVNMHEDAPGQADSSKPRPQNP